MAPGGRAPLELPRYRPARWMRGDAALRRSGCRVAKRSRTLGAQRRGHDQTEDRAMSSSSKRGPLSNPRHRRNVATEACDFCGAKAGNPCRRLRLQWNFAIGSYKPVIGSRVRKVISSRAHRWTQVSSDQSLKLSNNCGINVVR